MIHKIVIFKINIMVIFHLTYQRLCLFLVLASQGAEAGGEDRPGRDEITKKLKNFRLMNEDLITEGNLKTILDSLIEYVEYKMPHPASIDLSQYVSITAEIDSVIEDDYEDWSTLEEKFGTVLKKVKSL